MLHRTTLAALSALALSLVACAPLTAARPDHKRFGTFTDKNARNAAITFSSDSDSGNLTPWQSPRRIYDASYWVDGESNSDNASSALDAGCGHVVWFKIELTNTSTPVGSFAIQVSDDGTNDWTSLYLDANRVYGSNFTNAGAYPGGFTIGVSDIGNVVIYVGVENPGGYLRIYYDRASGGAANTVDATSFYRCG